MATGNEEVEGRLEAGRGEPVMEEGEPKEGDGGGEGELGERGARGGGA